LLFPVNPDGAKRRISNLKAQIPQTKNRRRKAPEFKSQIANFTDNTTYPTLENRRAGQFLYDKVK
jgi:hypothetical protein